MSNVKNSILPQYCKPSSKVRGNTVSYICQYYLHLKNDSLPIHMKILLFLLSFFLLIKHRISDQSTYYTYSQPLISSSQIHKHYKTFFSAKLSKTSFISSPSTDCQPASATYLWVNISIVQTLGHGGGEGEERGRGRGHVRGRGVHGPTHTPAPVQRPKTHVLFPQTFYLA